MSGLSSSRQVGRSQIAPSENAKGTVAANKLTVGSLYVARVVSQNRSTRTIDVKTSNGQVVRGCRLMAAGLASMIGITQVGMPPIGATVILAYFGQNTPFVLGVGVERYMSKESMNQPVPPVTGDYDFHAVKELDSLNIQSEDPLPVVPGLKMPMDMLPGEVEWSSGLGTWFRLFFNFAQMSAGDLAKVEVHLMNDMVRIVDNYFAHHNVGGDTLIWSNGRCNYESHFTSYPHEAEGKTEKSEPLATGDDYKPETDPDNFSATGRWRKSTYVGFLGDMIHTFVTSPTEVASNFMEESFRGGQFRQWVGSDGTFFVQAAGGVQIEMNKDIVIPSILKAWNDPSHKKDFLDGTAMKSLDSQFLKMWGEGPDWKDMKVACWQMRTYLKYIPLWHSLARFKQMEKQEYCKIPTEAEAPETDRNAEEEDKKQVNSNAESGTYYCALSMDMSGSISLISNDDTSIIMNQGNIQIACPGNIELKAGNTVHISGKNVAMHSADRMEIVSFAGGLWLKSRNLFYALCEKGRMFFKSDAKEGETSKTPTPFSDSDIESEVEMEEYGIVFDASKSKVLSHGAKGVTIGASQSEGNIHIEAKGGESDVVVIATQDIKLRGMKSVLLNATKFGIAAVTKIATGLLKIGDSLLMQSGVINLIGSLTVSGSVRSSNGFQGGQSEHVGKGEVEPPEVENELADEAGTLASEAGTVADYESKFMTTELQSLKWKFSEWEVGTEVDKWDSLKASMWDDFAENKVEPGEQQKDDKPEPMDAAKISALKLLSADRIDTSNVPYPGKSGKIFYFTDKQAKALTDKWDKHFEKSDIGGVKKMNSKPYQFYFRKKK